MPCPPPGDPPDPGIELMSLMSPALAGMFFTTSTTLYVCTYVRTYVKVKSLSHVRLFATPWTVAYQASQSMEFSRQDYWSGLPFRIDWLDLLAVQGTLKSLLQHHRLKASLLRHTIFFVVQFSQEYEFRNKDIIAFIFFVMKECL